MSLYTGVGFEIGHLLAETSPPLDSHLDTRDPVVIASFTVNNTGGREGVDIVPVYVKRPVNTGEILTPTNGNLVGWARVDVAAGASQQVSVGFRVSQLAVTPADINGDGPRQVQPGDYQVVLDPNGTGPTFTIR